MTFTSPTLCVVAGLAVLPRLHAFLLMVALLFLRCLLFGSQTFASRASNLQFEHAFLPNYDLRFLRALGPARLGFLDVCVWNFFLISCAGCGLSRGALRQHTNYYINGLTSVLCSS